MRQLKFKNYVKSILSSVKNSDQKHSLKTEDLEAYLGSLREEKQRLMEQASKHRHDIHILAMEKARLNKRLRKSQKLGKQTQAKIDGIPNHNLRVEQFIASYHELVRLDLFPKNYKPSAHKSILEFGFEDEEKKKQKREALFFECTQEVINAFTSYESSFLNKEQEANELKQKVTAPQTARREPHRLREGRP